MINLEPEFLKFLSDSKKEIENASALAVKLYLAFEAGYNHRKRKEILGSIEIGANIIEKKNMIKHCKTCFYSHAVTEKDSNILTGFYCTVLNIRVKGSDICNNWKKRR